MSEWKKVKLGELYSVNNGLSKGRQFFGSGYPFLTFSNVFNNWFLPEELESFVQSSEKERQTCSIKKGDVFITRTSETMDELGMSSVALKDYPNATYNGFTKRLRPLTDEVIPEYIGYYLRSPKFRGGYSIAESIKNKPEDPDERVDYINCIMTANDGVFSITDKTNDVIYGGTYRLQSVQPEVTNYIITINDVEGTAVSGTITYADGSTTNTLIISISDYTLTFYESK